MPNWCENTLEVTGDAEQLKHFVQAVKTETEILSFESLLPTPKELLEDNGAAGRMPLWYTWRHDNWGTKWDVDKNDSNLIQQIRDYWWDGSKDADDLEILAEKWQSGFYFWTAWSPPVPFVDFASKIFPTLTFNLKYFEGGNVFAGEIEVRNGVYSINCDFDIDNDPDTFTAFVVDNFDQNFGSEEQEGGL